MAKTRAELMEILKTISENVYYQSPSNVTMKYPCIRCAFDGDFHLRADDKRYITYGKYTITNIYKSLTNRSYDVIMNAIPFVSFDRSYISDGLYHDVFTLYF